MNPHYNQQQPPYYNYQQHTPGPPQPPWQPQPPSGWNDPRFQNAQHPAAPPPNPQYSQGTYAPPAGQPANYPSYGPTSPQSTSPRPEDNFHGSTAPQYGTAAWGVRYNQTPQPQQPQQPQQHHNQYHHDAQHYLQPEQKPALPPRPTSAQAQPTQQFTPGYNYSQPPSSNQYQPQGSWNLAYAQPHEPKPPTPPPRPAAYTTPSQFPPSGQPQEQYSHHPLTHNYEPQTQPQPNWQQPQQDHTSAPGGTTWDQPQQGTNEFAAPTKDDGRRFTLPTHSLPENAGASVVGSPQQSQPQRASISGISEVQTSATALGGHGRNPSDWQLYSPLGQHDQAEADDERTPTIKQSSKFSASPEPINAHMGQGNIQTQFSQFNMSSQPQPLQPQQQPQLQPQYISQSPVAERKDVQRPSAAAPNSSQNQISDNRTPEPQVSRPSTVSSMSGAARNDTIDNVIQAWYAPLMVDSSIQTSLPPSRVTSPDVRSRSQVGPAIHNIQTQTDFPPQVETREIEKDPYEDIQNEYKATLKRFAGMLRQEAAAEGDEEKFQIFQGFVIRELRLRSVLYGVEATPQEQPQKQPSAQAVEQRNNGQQDPETARLTSPNASKQMNKPPAGVRAEISTQLPKLNLEESSRPSSRDDSYVVVNANDDDEYSPGGRPRMTSRGTTVPVNVDSTAAPAHNVPNTGPVSLSNGSGDMSPSLNAPMTLDDYVMPERPSSTKNVTATVGSNHELHMPPGNALTSPASAALTGPINFQPDRTPYQPFRYGEGSQAPIPEVRIHAPTDSYTTLRQNQAAESGRTLVSDPPPANLDSAPDRSQSATPSGGRREHEEAFIGLIRAKSKAIRNTQKSSGHSRPDSPAILRAGTPLPRSSPAPPPVSPLIKSIQSLRATVPKSVPLPFDPESTPPAKLEPIVSMLQKMGDDFGFIHSRVLSWDKSNRQVRGKQESERQVRQSENESHIDELFNDNEIGYADIAVLEKKFQLDEAGKKYKEDQDELDSFTKGVYHFVVEKIEDEITDLTRLQSTAIDVLDLESVSAAKQLQSLTSEPADSSNPRNRASVCIAMELLHEIHDKLEIRHLKVAEANFERERRRKRLELSVLYTNDDRPGIRKLEAEFSKAEKLQVLEESRKKAERITRLLDSFDRAVVRGLAEDQDVVDDMLAKVKAVHDLLLNASPADIETSDSLYGPEGVRDLLVETSTAVDYLLDDSTSLVKLLSKADTSSNDADFALYIAEAKLADESPEKFEKLKREKEAEDRKINEELTTRLNGIAMTPGDVKRLIRELRDKVGEDSGHKERISKALEAAKARNATASG